LTVPGTRKEGVVVKKSLALLLGLMLVMGFVVVACGGGATETTAAEQVTTTVAASNAVDWTEAADYEGSQATVTGKVAAVDNKFTEKGVLKILVRVGGVQTVPHFNIVIELAEGGTIPVLGVTEEMLNGLIGKTVEITGTVVLNAFDVGAYEIFLTDPAKLVVK
jgi:hypothetical protein